MNSFGSKLKEERKKANLSIDEVSEKTKIRPHLITKLEKGDFSFLPPVYISSFLRTYGKLLEIPESEIEDAIDSLSDKPKETKPEKDSPKKITFDDEKEETQPAPEKPYQKQQNKNKYKSPNVVNYLIYLALGLTVVALVYITFFSEDKTNTQDFPAQSDIQSIEPDTTVITSDKGLKDFYAKPDSIILKAVATDTAWMSITIDGKRNEQLTMYPDMEKRWAASDYFILSIGNEGAVQFIRNGETLKPFGKKGTVVRNVKITENEVESSSKPWNSSSKRRTNKKEEERRMPVLEPSKVKPSVKPFENKEEEKNPEEPKEDPVND